MSNYLNLEKPTENDLNWGDSINDNTDKIDAECSRLNTELGNKSDVGHTHNFDTLYAPLEHSHNFDDRYSQLSHNHNSLYSPTNHNHNSLYSATGHTHAGFSLTNHTHSEIAQILSRLALAEGRINTLFSDKADKSYVHNLLQNFDHSVAGLTPQVNINGQGANASNLRVSAWINSPAFLLEWHLSFKWGNLQNFSNQAPKHASEFTISKPSPNAPYWGGNTMTSVTIKIKCRNPFLNDNWSNEVTVTENEVMMYNFIDADKIIAALSMDSHFQTTLASVIITNPYMAEKLINSATTSSNT